MESVAFDGSGRTYVGGGFQGVAQTTGTGLKLTTTDDVPASGYAEVPNGPDGPVGTIRAVAADGIGGWFIGGDFTEVAGVPRSGLAHINADGSLDPIWNPAPTGGEGVGAIVVSGSDLFVGGSFIQIGGQPRNNIAKLSSTGTGAADPTWNPNADGFVFTLTLSGSDVYAGGNFTSIGGETRNLIAKLSSTGTGAADPTWNPNPTGGFGNVWTIAVSGSDVYVGGDFTSIGGQSRNNIAKLSSTGTGAANATWNPDAGGFVRRLVVSGSDVFAGGDFSGANSIGGQSRDHLAKLSSTGAGAADATWDPSPNSEVWDIEVSGTDVYVAGEFGSIGGQLFEGFAKVSSTGTGAADPGWNPGPIDEPNSPSGYALAVQGTDIYAGGEFYAAQLELRQALVRLNPDRTLDSSWNPNPTGPVFAIAISGSDVYVGGAFAGVNSIGGQTRNRIAKLSTTNAGAADATWNPNANNNVNALAVSGTDVYVGGDFDGANSIGGQARDYIAKLSAGGTGAADPAWTAAGLGIPVDALAVAGPHVYLGGTLVFGRVSTAAPGVPDLTWNPAATGPVRTIAISGSDVFVGGSFAGVNSIGGQDRDRIAKLSTASPLADPTWNPAANASVNALAISGSDVYAGGAFSTIGNGSHDRLAKFSATGTGAADPAFDPDPDGPVNALAVSGGTLAAGGAFDEVDPYVRRGLAHFDITSPPPVTPPVVAPPPAVPAAPGPTGKREAALRKCFKKKFRGKRKKCRKKARKLPV